MKSKLFFTLMILGLLTTDPLKCSAEIYWRISIKFIMGPALEMPAYGPFDPFTGAALNIQVINADLEGKGSPYRFQLIEAIAVPGISEFFGEPVNEDTRDALDAAAKADKDLYAWRDDAINVYVNGTSSGTYAGYCSFPSGGKEAIIVRADSSASTLFHETGHFFNLRHTHHGSVYDPDIGCNGGPYFAGDEDGCDDTLPDHPCFDRDGIAEHSFGNPYDALSAARKQLVDNTWLNLMAYHHEGTRITSDQWTRVDEATAEVRSYVVEQRHWFVDLNNGCDAPNGSRRCAFNSIGPFGILQSGGGPFPAVGDGVDAAAAGDLVRIHAGTYDESLTIAKAVTLRADHGLVTIR